MKRVCWIVVAALFVCCLWLFFGADDRRSEDDIFRVYSVGAQEIIFEAGAGEDCFDGYIARNGEYLFSWYMNTNGSCRLVIEGEANSMKYQLYDVNCDGEIDYKVVDPTGEYGELHGLEREMREEVIPSRTIKVWGYKK